MTKLKRVRLQNRLTRRELAEKSGVNIRMIQKYESGEKNIDHAQAVTLFRLSYVLGCDMQYLLEHTEIILKDMWTDSLKQKENAEKNETK